MEEYLQYMKTLRFQMNDVEEQVAKISFEEQMYITTIQTLEKDLDLVKVEIKRLQEEAENMIKSKGQICSQILEKQRKIVSLESDSSTLIQSLELIQQERESLSAKLVEKSTYYTKVAEDITAQLKEHQDWVDTHQHGLLNGKHGLDQISWWKIGLAKERDGLYYLKQGAALATRSITSSSSKEVPHEGENKVDEKPCKNKDSHDDTVKHLMENLGAAQVKFNQLTEQKSRLVAEYSKVKVSANTVNCKINEFKQELREMDEKSLEEELQALFSDKVGVTEYMQSLQLQILKMKEISNLVKCSCGEEFKVELGTRMSNEEAKEKLN